MKTLNEWMVVRSHAAGWRGPWLLLAATVLAVASLTRADDAAPPAAPAAPSATAKPGEADLRKIEGVFDSDLPKTERKGSFRLIVHPHFGDLTNRDYLRILTGLRWGVNDHTELTVGMESFFDHGLKHTSEGNGIGDLRLGGKYGFGEKIFPGYDTSVGFNLYFPVGHPPLSMTNGHNEYSPFVVFGKKIDRYPGLTVFLNTGVNLLQATGIPGSFDRNVPHSNSVVVTPGLVYDRKDLHYTLELAYETTSLLGRDNKQFFTVRPGLAWDLPPKLKFHSKGRVTAGAGIHVTFGPDGVSTGGGGKIRAEFGISRWFRRDAKKDDGK